MLCIWLFLNYNYKIPKACLTLQWFVGHSGKGQVTFVYYLHNTEMSSHPDIELSVFKRLPDIYQSPRVSSVSSL